jgi:hypothetical protein
MSDPVPLSALKTLGVSTITPIGSDGAGNAKILSAAEIRAAAESYSSAQVDTALALRVPYTGANAAVDLGSQSLTCGTSQINGAPSFISSTPVVSVRAVSGQRGIYVEPSSGSVGLWVNQSGFLRSGGVAAVSVDCASFTPGLLIRSNAGTNIFSVAESGAITGLNNVIRQHNGLNPQTYELFGTYTSATSFESLCLKATATAHQIGSTIGTGGGTNRPVQLGHFNSAGAFTIGLSVLFNGDVAFHRADPFNPLFYAGNNEFSLRAIGSIGFRNTNNAQSGTTDTKLVRHTLATLGSYANGGFVIRNLANSADADLTCAAITSSGNLNLTSLPTSDPGVAGRVWRDGTNLRISV